MNLYYSPEYTCNAHPFDTTRKSGWIAQSLASDPIGGVTIKRPPTADPSSLELVHEIGYIKAIMDGEPRHLAESNGLPWDNLLWNATTAQIGGVVSAAHDALKHGVSGSLSSGLHHARHDRGAGFCTFNGLVIAAREAQNAGAKNILILDLDAHCGGGTDSLIVGDKNIWHLDISVNSFDKHQVDDHSRLEIVYKSAEYLPVIRACLSDLADSAPSFDLCLYNAGMDPFEFSDIGGLPGITKEVLAERERMVFDWCAKYHVPVAFVLAGGYTGMECSRQQLVDLHRLTIEAAYWSFANKFSLS